MVPGKGENPTNKHREAHHNGTNQNRLSVWNPDCRDGAHTEGGLKGVAVHDHGDDGSRREPAWSRSDPFRHQRCCHPAMGGSNSLTQVLPVFTPDLSYEALEIGNGGQALDAFMRLAEEHDQDRTDAIRRAL